MPNQRAPGQKLLTIPASENFIRDMDNSLPAAGYSNRSQFVRDAIIEKLQRAGIRLPKELALAPVRSRPSPDINSSEKSPEEELVDAIEAEADALLEKSAGHTLPKSQPQPAASPVSKKPRARRSKT